MRIILIDFNRDILSLLLCCPPDIPITILSVTVRNEKFYIEFHTVDI